MITLEEILIQEGYDLKNKDHRQQIQKIETLLHVFESIWEEIPVSDYYVAYIESIPLGYTQKQQDRSLRTIGGIGIIYLNKYCFSIDINPLGQMMICSSLPLTFSNEYVYKYYEKYDIRFELYTTRTHMNMIHYFYRVPFEYTTKERELMFSKKIKDLLMKLLLNIHIKEYGCVVKELKIQPV